MLFNSHLFLFIFLPITIIGFVYIRKYKNINLLILWLIICSICFYAAWEPKYIILILSSVIGNYTIGYLVSQTSHSKIIKRRSLTSFGVIGNLLLLGYFKYINFFIENIEAVTDNNFNFEEVILPLAISFFTFQQIAFIIDTYKGGTRHPSFLPYCLYVLFFPQLIAGPIVYHKFMISQLETPKEEHPFFHIKASWVAVGTTIFAIGLIKKVLFADQLALIANPVFDAAASGLPISSSSAWLGSLAYTLQLYFDFSGYSDMAIGLAAIFGLRLPFNFNSPYKSLSIIDFWQRWHMTLSRFLRDYLYIPLGGNRSGEGRRYANIFIVMLLGGLWHGAGWTFVAWGAFHGLLIIINHTWRQVVGRVTATDRITSIAQRMFEHGLSWGLTFLAIMVGWVMFRAETFDAAFLIYNAMFFGLGSGAQDGVLVVVDTWPILLLTLAMFIAIVLPNSQTWVGLTDGNPSHQRLVSVLWRPKIPIAIAMGLAFSFAVYMVHGPSDFLYFQF